MVTTPFVPQEALSTDSFRLAALRLLSAILGALNGTTNAWTNSSVTLAYTAATGAGTVAAGAYSVSIANVGNAAGTVKTISVPAGAVVEFEAFTDPVAQEVKKLPAIVYNATGTTFNIAVES